MERGDLMKNSRCQMLLKPFLVLMISLLLSVLVVIAAFVAAYMMGYLQLNL